MRVNIYAEEMTNHVKVISKTTADGEFTGIRFWLHLPVTVNNPNGQAVQMQGPFMHHPGDDDSSAVTFWGKRDLKRVLLKALQLLEEHSTSNMAAVVNVQVSGLTKYPKIDGQPEILPHSYFPERKD